jgi:hypothetical protein
MADAFRWEPTDLPADPPLLLEPTRLAVFIGVLGFLAGAAVPWARGPQSSTPIFDQDGVLMVIAAMLAVVLSLSRSAAESTTRTIQAAPAIVGALATAAWLSAYQSAVDLVRAGNAAAHAAVWVLEPTGLALSGLGASIAAVALGVLSIRAWRANGTGQTAGDVRLTRRSIVRALIEIGCGVTGLVGGILVSINLLPLPFLIAWVFVTIGGGALGLAIGQRLAQRI